MTQHTVYQFTCDGCGVKTTPNETATLEDGWASMYIANKDYSKQRTLHWCKKCTGGIIDGFTKEE